MQIVKFEDSPIKTKRYRITMDDGKHYDFGLKGGSTYIDHGDAVKRTNYLKRHLASEKERYLIKHYIPSPALFSAQILWGWSTDINENIKYLNNFFIKYK